MVSVMDDINRRLVSVLDYFFNGNVSEMARKTNVPQPTLNNIVDNRLSKPSAENLSRIANSIELLNSGWLLTGEGEMLKDNKKSDISDISSERKNLIPFYDNVATVGGHLNMSADVDTPHSVPTEYIDTGDWFREATAAIRHYEDSMDEYPSGCILALKEVKDRQLVVPGRDYVIETDEYRVTKRVQLGKDDEHIIAYSTNKETYPDGKLIHEPFPIPKKAIRHISLVLGYVVKKNGGTMVYNTNSKR